MSADNVAWLSYRLRPREAAETVVGAYGGHPRGVHANLWPRCSVCSAPMCHMGQLDAGEWLDLKGFARLTVFICHATGGRCEDWDALKGANRVLLHEESDGSLYDGPPTVRVYRRVELAVSRPTDEQILMREAGRDPARIAEALSTIRHDKLGGGAVWLHGDATPASPIDGRPMRLALQMTTKVVHFDITSQGMGYVFLDNSDSSDSAAYFLWQGG